MKRPTKAEQLLDEVLADTASADFDQSLLRQMLQAARQRQRVRRRQQTMWVVAVVVALTFWLWPHGQTVPVQSAKEIELAPLAASVVNYVPTQPLPPGLLIETQTRLVAMIPTSSSAITLVATPAAEDLFQELNDDQLLALVEGRPVALVRYGPNEAALIMPDELLRDGFSVQ